MSHVEVEREEADLSCALCDEPIHDNQDVEAHDDGWNMTACHATCHDRFHRDADPVETTVACSVCQKDVADTDATADAVIDGEIWTAHRDCVDAFGHPIR